MSERVVRHEVKLQKSVIVILGFLAFGVCANALAPAFSVKDAHAQLVLGNKAAPVHIVCDKGCS
jgi:hypothetical protein